MTEQWQELKETIVEMRDNDGTGTQQEVCEFLVNYMGILEKQMQEPCEDCISRTEVIKSIDEREDVNGKVDAESVRTDIVLIPPVNPQACGDLISRKAIFEEFENDQYHLEFCKEHHIDRSISMEMVRIRLHDLPHVTPQPCEDAIGRSDMLDAIGHGTTYTSEELQRIIKGLPPVTPQPKMGEWISVEDRLPEEGEEVLVWYRYWRYGEYNNWYYTYGIGYQYTGIFSVIDGGVRQSVYAWQELPEQYIVEPQESERV